MAKKTKRTIASYRAASLKGARNKRLMKLTRSLERENENAHAQYQLKQIHKYVFQSFDDMLPPEKTINRIPKVEWK